VQGLKKRGKGGRDAGRMKWLAIWRCQPSIIHGPLKNENFPVD
jgi:hypothetical protein